MNAPESDVSATPRTDVIVIGGGVIGCFVADQLCDRGCRVTIVERDRIGSGASLGNCGYICPSHVLPLCGPGAIRQALPALLRRGGALSIPLRFDPPLWRWMFRFARACSGGGHARSSVARHDLLRQSDQMYRGLLASGSLRCQWQRNGLLMVHARRESYEHFGATARRLHDEFGVESQGHAGDQLTRLEPSLKDGLAGGWWFPGDSHLHPGELMNAMRDRLIGRGVTLMEDAEVLDWRIESGEVQSVATSRGSVVGEHYVLTTGA